MVINRFLKNIFVGILVTLALFIMYNNSCFAMSKTGTDYKVFSASVPELASYINWRVNFGIQADYTDLESNYKLTKIRTYAYIDPKREDSVGNGNIIGSIKETIDHSDSSTNRSLDTSFWSNATGIWSTSAYIFS